MPIDWTNPDAQVTTHFTVRDCLWLHSTWDRLATEEDGVDFTRLEALCQVLETVREVLGVPMNVHCMFRSEEYNKAQGILPKDVHQMSQAVDFDCSPHLTIQEVKDLLEPYLERLGIRMERGTSTWVHLDVHKVGPSGRYFTA